MKIKTYWEARFMNLELMTAVIMAVCFSVWSEFINKGQFVNAAFLDNRGAVYGALVGLFGSMLGFSITAVSIIIGYANSEKLEIVRSGKHYQDLWDVFKSAMKFLSLATISALLGLIFDTNTKPLNISLYINIFLALVCVFRVRRCIWVLENIITIVTKPRS